jgi:hypothetical protein
VEVVGAELELDRSILDRLGDPLVQQRVNGWPRASPKSERFESRHVVRRIRSSSMCVTMVGGSTSGLSVVERSMRA